MAGPAYIRREYVGGSQALQLAGQIGAGDLTITADPNVGEFSTWPTGATGDFTIGIDQGLQTLEKILCSAFDPSTGVFTVAVNGSWNGRGYDDTDPVAHVPQTNIPQIILTWTATEADETNEMVSLVMGGAAGTLDGLVLTSRAGKPSWQAPGGATAAGFPLGAMFAWPNVAQFPTNCFECNGQLISQATYSALYAILGNAFGGTGPGGTFGLPNMQDRFLVGMGTVIGTSVGATGGSRQMTQAQMPGHQHSSNENGQGQYATMYTSPNNETHAIGKNTDPGNINMFAGSLAVTGVAGNNQAFDPPFIALKWLMRVL